LELQLSWLLTGRAASNSVPSQYYYPNYIDVENAGVMNSFAFDFLNALGRRSSFSSDEESEVCT